MARLLFASTALLLLQIREPIYAGVRRRGDPQRRNVLPLSRTCTICNSTGGLPAVIYTIPGARR
jgi:hypothetical protein